MFGECTDERTLRCTLATGRHWPISDARARRLNVHRVHIASVQSADCMVCNAVFADTRQALAERIVRVTQRPHPASAGVATSELVAYAGEPYTKPV